MKTFRVVIGVLAIIPVAIFVDAMFIHPANYGENSLGELIFLAIGIPILILNMWAWVHPEIIERSFLGKDG